MAIQFKNLVDVFEQRTGAVATDAYTLTVSTEQTSGATPNPGTGGLKVQYYSVSSGTTHGFGLVAGSSSSDFLTSGPMYFYTNSDLDTKSATGFAMAIDNFGRVGIGETSPDEILHIKGSTPKIKLEHSSGYFESKVEFYSTTGKAGELAAYNNPGFQGIILSYDMGTPTTRFQVETNKFRLITNDPANYQAKVFIDEYIVHEGDPDTKFGFPAADTFTITTSSAERLRVKSDGAIQQANSSATGQYAAAFGQNNTANSLEAFATGENTTASGRQSFSGGFNTTASGDGSFAHGGTTLAQGTNSFAAGAETEAIGTGAAAFNNQTNATGVNSFAIGGNTTASGEASFASGVSTLSQGIGSVSSGLSTNAAANGTHVSGVASTATGLFSSAQGDSCLAQGQASVAMGYIAEARGNFGSAAIGFNVDANGQSSLAVNQQNVAQGNNSIAAGFQTNIDSNESMGMGFHCKSQAGTKQDNQFLFGRYLTAPQSSGGTQAGQSQFVVGRHNQFNSQPHTAFVVGNGIGIGAESNAFRVEYTGNAQVQGSIAVGDDGRIATANSAGSIRYRTTSNSSHVDMVMQTGASTYAWVNIVTNTW